MNTRQMFNQLMKEQTEMALATAKGTAPNVRIVNFYYDEAEKKVFFSTFGDNDKVNEITENAQVSFTTIPKEGIKHVRANGEANASTKTIYDVKEGFVDRVAGYEETINQVGQFLEVYEIIFDKAVVTLDFETSDMLLV